MLRTAEGVKPEAPTPSDEWGYRIAIAQDWAEAITYALAATVVFERRMLVRNNYGNTWGIYPENAERTPE